MQRAGLIPKTPQRLKDVARKPPEHASPGTAQAQHSASPSSGIASWDFARIPIDPPERRETVQPKLEIGAVDDPLEHEADRVADRVLRATSAKVSVTRSAPQVSRKCAGCEKEDEERQKVQLKPATSSRAQNDAAPGIVRDVLQSPGRPLDAPTRTYFERRFGHDFSNVRVHTDSRATASAAAIGASAYTYGSNIVFGAGRYEPGTSAGRRLLAHELTHVIQQGPLERGARRIQRQTCTPAEPGEVASGLRLSGFKQGSYILPGQHYPTLQALAARLKRAAASGEVQAHGYASQEGDAAFNVRLSCTRAFGVKQVIQANGVRNPISLFQHGATTALGKTEDDNRAVIVTEPASPKNQEKPADKPPQTTKPPADTAPKPSCAPDPGCPPEYCTAFATTKEAEDDRTDKAEGILTSLPVSKTKALFREFIFGGGPLRDISADFAVDFTNSETTIAVTNLLNKRIEDAIKSHPPAFPEGATTVTLNIRDALGEATLNQIMDGMKFSNPTEAPGLLAGGIGTNQRSCRVGAKPSDQDDARLAEGTVIVTKGGGGTVSVSPPVITYTVKDTIDFCPGFCGTGRLAFNLTVPMSRWEASGISGDVPFTITFPAPVGSAGSEE
jgi:outer membrane protein OmpA-like peptidoglycan-associated protein